MKKQNLKVDYKSTQLISILSQHLTGKMNLARIKFFGMLFAHCAKCRPFVLNGYPPHSIPNLKLRTLYMNQQWRKVIDIVNSKSKLAA